MAPGSPELSLESLLLGGGSADQVYAALLALPEEARAPALRALSPVARRHLPGRRAAAHPDDQRDALLGLMFDSTPDEEAETLARLVWARFHLRVGADRDPSDGKGRRWEARGLRRLWRVLAALPPADIEDNERLRRLARFDVDAGAQASGNYGARVAAIGYDPATLEQAERSFAQGPPSRQLDPLYGVNAFDETVRHEVGHAVDVRLGIMDRHGAEPAFGGWRAYGKDVLAVARAMAEAAAGPIHGWAEAAERERLIAWLARRLERGDAARLDEALGELEFLDEERRARLRADAALRAAACCKADDEPWMRGDLDGGVALGGRIFQESYAGYWYSYDHAARARKVSLYQFRAPAEWFAEAYAAYWEPPREPGGERGARLKERDPALWDWFRRNLEGL